MNDVPSRRHECICIGLVTLLLPVLVVLAESTTSNPRPPFSIATDTTFYTEPRLPDGGINYSAALNRELGKDVAPQDNACISLFQAIGRYNEDIDRSIWIWNDQQIEDFFRKLQSPAPAPQGAYLPGIAEVHEDASAPLNHLRQAAMQKAFFFPFVSRANHKLPRQLLLGSAYPCSRTFQAANRVLRQRGLALTRQGRQFEGLKELIASLQLGRQLSRAPHMSLAAGGLGIEQAAIADLLEILPYQALTDSQWKAIQESFAACRTRAPVYEKVRLAERCICLDAVQALAIGGQPSIAGITELYGIHRLREQCPDLPVDWDLTMKRVNKSFDRLADAMAIPDGQTRQAVMNEIQQELDAFRVSDPSDYGEFVGLPMLVLGCRQYKEVHLWLQYELEKIAKHADLVGNDPAATELRHKVRERAGKAYAKAFIAIWQERYFSDQQFVDRLEQSSRHLEVAVAVAAYRSKHRRYPEELSDLVPDFLDEIPTDIFSNSRPKYNEQEQQFRVYSVGPNGMDDQGSGDDLMTLL